MEILQKIWTILITENEKLTNILVASFTFIEIYLHSLIFTFILNINTTTKQRLLYVFSYSIISIFSMFLIPSPYYTFINLLAFPILVFLILKTTVLKSIISEIIIYTVTLIIGTPLILVCIYFFNIPSNLIEIIPLYRILYCIVFYLLLYGIYIIIYKSNIHINISKFNKLKKNNSRYLIFNFILGTIAIAIQCFLEFVYIDYIPLYLILISLFILLLYFGISLYSLYRTSKLEVTAQNLEEQKLYNHTLTLLYDNIRGFKHDFNNIVQGIGGYISTNNIDGLKEYYSEILEDCQKVNNLALLSPDIINNPAIYSLLTAKYHIAMESGIKMNLEIFMDLSNINMKIYELTRILGILIDNAIEAAKQCDEKEITITIRKDNKKNKQLFIVENTYINKDVNIDKIFEKGKTSKRSEDAKNHGLGLWEVRQIIKKNKNLDLFTSKSDKYFKQQFEIYC